MKFQQLREKIEKNTTIIGKYKNTSYKIFSSGSMFSLTVDNEKVDEYKTSKEAEKAAKEFIELAS